MHKGVQKDKSTAHSPHPTPHPTPTGGAGGWSMVDGGGPGMLKHIYACFCNMMALSSPNTSHLASERHAVATLWPYVP